VALESGHFGALANETGMPNVAPPGNVGMPVCRFHSGIPSYFLRTSFIVVQ
jgi:hypothetical protein